MSSTPLSSTIHRSLSQKLTSYESDSENKSLPNAPTSSNAVATEATGCPFSDTTSTKSKPAFPDLHCPVTNSKGRTASARSWHSSTSRSRAPTEVPDLRRTPSVELLYLPPLLSLLPPSTTAPVLRDVSNLKVGYTQSHLPAIDEASVALHDQLHSFRPKTDQYAYEHYDEAFTFDEIRLPKHLEREWYIVAFRSTRAKDSPSRDLYEADRQAHEEAVTAGGLLAYWFGVPNSRGSNLATCIWMSRAHAVRAIAGPKHVEAMRLAEAMYANYDLERYVLRKVKGEEGVTVEPWRGGEVSFGEDYVV